MMIYWKRCIFMIRFSPTARKVDEWQKIKEFILPKDFIAHRLKTHTLSHTYILYLYTHSHIDSHAHTCRHVYIHVCIPVNSTSPRPTRDYCCCVHGRCYCYDIRTSHYAPWLRIVSHTDNEIRHLKSKVCFAKSHRKDGESSDQGHETQLIIALLLSVKARSRMILTYKVGETSKCAFALLLW